jgi:hypothetical protein
MRERLDAEQQDEKSVEYSPTWGIIALSTRILQHGASDMPG